jgi:hypothetical protein
VKQHHQLGRLGSALGVVALLAASCSSGSDTTSSTDGPPASDTADTGVVDSDPVEPESTEPPSADSAPTETDPPDSAPSDTDASEAEPPAAEGGADFGSRGPAAGEPILVGMVNTEGTAGLDFPEMRTDTDLAVTYLNDHGGMGGRPVQVEHCAAAVRCDGHPCEACCRVTGRRVW